MDTTPKEDGINPYKVIGTRPIRHDGVDKVTGRAKYANDIHFPDLLHAKIVRSPHAHARLVSIDVSAAVAYPGVTAVVTHADLGDVADREHEMRDIGHLRHLRDNLMARDKVLYHGHAMAAVAAISPHIAEAAALLIQVEYEILPHVLDCKAAMQAGSPILHENLRTKEIAHTCCGDTPTNIAAHFQHKRGNLEKGFAEADVIIEREFKTAMVHQGYIEPQSSTVLWREDGQILVWTSTQNAFCIREQMAELLQKPVSKIKVIPLEIGGGFGGKFVAYTDLPAALLSKKSGHRPVKLALSRSEVLQATGPAPGSYLRVKIGANQQGKLTAGAAELIFEAGAYPGSPVEAGIKGIFAPYRLANVQIDGYDVVNNRARVRPYRAPGGPTAAFASETVIDEVAEMLGIDPIEFRRRNAVMEGDLSADGTRYARIGLTETLDAALNHPHYQAPLAGKHRGRGVATGFWFNGSNPSSINVIVNADGGVNLIIGSTDIGGLRTAAAMMLAETLGISAEDVNPQVVDTDSISFTGNTAASSGAFKLGWTTHTAGLQIRAIVAQRLAEQWAVAPDQIQFEHGVFAANGKHLTFKAAVQQVFQKNAPITASVAMTPAGAGPVCATHIVDVEVDPETGKVEILRYTAVQDVGRAIHPSYVEGQIQGSVAQGIGMALYEEYCYDQAGRLLNASLLDYRMPTALDLPMIEPVLVEVNNPAHPYGVRGVGEVSVVPSPAALANAIYRAVGVRMRELPMSAEKIALKRIYPDSYIFTGALP